MNYKECKVRPQIVNVNSVEPVFFPFSIKISKWNGSCNNVNDPYAKLCVPGVVKNLNVRAFNLMSRTNETRNIEWHETCKCKCRLDSRFCNNKQCWNEHKCRCVNINNWLVNVYAIKDLLGILVIVNANAWIMWCWWVFRLWKL